jgi:two-component system chemotaxis sensor kinase CheA
MQPIGVVWNKLPRVVRDLASASGKSIGIEMDGADTELDKTIIEAIKAPLTHLVRNCCDHGIEAPSARKKSGKSEQGKISLRAYHEGGQVNIEISDDGSGIDTEKLKSKALQKGLVRPEHIDRMSERELLDLIFLPGFSTAEKVTNISGRGVGMDVVKNNIEKIGGAVDVSTHPGRGTTFKVKIPLTLAIIPGLVVTSEGERFVIPQVSLLELIGLEGAEGRKLIESVHGIPVYRRRGKLLPLVYLNRVLQVPESQEATRSISLVVLQAEDRPFGLVVDGICDTQEIVVKPLGKQLKGLSCYAGACIMGDGRVALILDVMGLAQQANVVDEARAHVLAEKSAETVASSSTQTFLLFAGPDEARMAVPLGTVARLEELSATQAETAGTQWVAQYRGQILPLVNLQAALEERRQRKRHSTNPSPIPGQPLQVVVCNHEDHLVGLMVEHILDIVEDAADLKYPSTRPGVLHSAVIQGKVTELIDVPAVLRASGISFATAQIQTGAAEEISQS